MDNQFVATFFQDIDDDVLLQLFHETSLVKEGELVHFWLVREHVYPGVYLMFHGTRII